MKILRISSDLYPHIIGGNAIHAHELSKKQVELGNSVTVFTSCIGNNPIDSITNYDIINIDNTIKLAGNSICPALLLKLVFARYDYDIIHAHSHLYFSTNVASAIRKLGSSPLVITNHGIRSSSVPDWINSLYLGTLGKLTLKSADRIICYTNEEKKIFNDVFKIKDEKISVIPNGIDSDLFRPKINIDKDIDKANECQATLLWVGRLVVGKGVKYLIKAVSILKKRIPQIELLLVGEGPQKKEILNQIYNLNLVNNVKMIDYIPNNLMPDVYNKADLFVLPSCNEGVPRTILEAMACEVPIICSEIPHLVPIVKDCGLLVPKRNPSAIADAIFCLISDKDKMITFKKNARNSVLENYSWDKTVNMTLNLYRELIG